MKKKLIVLVILSLMVLSFIPVRMITTSDESFIVSARADIGPMGPPLCYECEYTAGWWYCITVPPNPSGGSHCETGGGAFCNLGGECSW